VVTQKPRPSGKTTGVSFLSLPPQAYIVTLDAPSARMMTGLTLASKKTAVPGERLHSSVFREAARVLEELHQRRVLPVDTRNRWRLGKELPVRSAILGEVSGHCIAEFPSPKAIKRRNYVKT
jgi:hypothetical protein